MLLLESVKPVTHVTVETVKYNAVQVLGHHKVHQSVSLAHQATSVLLYHQSIHIRLSSAQPEHIVLVRDNKTVMIVQPEIIVKVVAMPWPLVLLEHFREQSSPSVLNAPKECTAMTLL